MTPMPASCDAAVLVGYVPVRRPFPWSELLDYLAPRLIVGAESIEHDRYVRLVGARRIVVSFEARHARLKVQADGKVDVSGTLARVGRLLDTEHDARRIRAHLRGCPMLAPRLAAVPGMRPLGAWSPFELCVRTILGQQVTVAAAGTLMRRLVQRCGAVTPACILAADLAAMGMPGRRVQTIRSFAQALLDGRVDLSKPWDDIEAALQGLPGFGPWTRAYLGIRLGRDPDAFPASDVGLLRAANVATPAQLLELAERWRPYRAYAATYMWTVAL